MAGNNETGQNTAKSKSIVDVIANKGVKFEKVLEKGKIPGGIYYEINGYKIPEKYKEKYKKIPNIQNPYNNQFQVPLDVLGTMTDVIEEADKSYKIITPKVTKIFGPLNIGLDIAVSIIDENEGALQAIVTSTSSGLIGSMVGTGALMTLTLIFPAGIAVTAISAVIGGMAGNWLNSFFDYIFDEMKEEQYDEELESYDDYQIGKNERKIANSKNIKKKHELKLESFRLKYNRDKNVIIKYNDYELYQKIQECKNKIKSIDSEINSIKNSLKGEDYFKLKELLVEKSLIIKIKEKLDERRTFKIVRSIEKYKKRVDKTNLIDIFNKEKKLKKKLKEYVKIGSYYIAHIDCEKSRETVETILNYIFIIDEEFPDLSNLRKTYFPMKVSSAPGLDGGVFIGAVSILNEIKEILSKKESYLINKSKLEMLVSILYGHTKFVPSQSLTIEWFIQKKADEEIDKKKKDYVKFVNKIIINEEHKKKYIESNSKLNVSNIDLKLISAEYEKVNKHINYLNKSNNLNKELTSDEKKKIDWVISKKKEWLEKYERTKVFSRKKEFLINFQNLDVHLHDGKLGNSEYYLSKLQSELQKVYQNKKEKQKDSIVRNEAIKLLNTEKYKLKDGQNLDDLIDIIIKNERVDKLIENYNKSKEIKKKVKKINEKKNRRENEKEEFENSIMNHIKYDNLGYDAFKEEKKEIENSIKNSKKVIAFLEREKGAYNTKTIIDIKKKIKLKEGEKAYLYSDIHIFQVLRMIKRGDIEDYKDYHKGTYKDYIFQIVKNIGKDKLVKMYFDERDKVRMILKYPILFPGITEEKLFESSKLIDESYKKVKDWIKISENHKNSFKDYEVKINSVMKYFEEDKGFNYTFKELYEKPDLFKKYYDRMEFEKEEIKMLSSYPENARRLKAHLRQLVPFNNKYNLKDNSNLSKGLKLKISEDLSRMGQINLDQAISILLEKYPELTRELNSQENDQNYRKATDMN